VSDPFEAMLAKAADMAKVFRALRPVCAEGSRLCFVIGDSAPYGVHAPAEQWLGRLAESAGFHSVSFDKLRDQPAPIVYRP
jgi:hypothetical protein